MAESHTTPLRNGYSHSANNGQIGVKLRLTLRTGDNRGKRPILRKAARDVGWTEKGPGVGGKAAEAPLKRGAVDNPIGGMNGGIDKRHEL